MLKTFLQFTAIILVLLSVIFSVQGTLKMSPKNMLDLSSSNWDSSPHAVKSYCGQKANVIISTVFLFTSFAFQIWVTFLPQYADDKVKLKTVLFSFFICLILWFFGNLASNYLENLFHKQVLQVQKAK